MIIRIFKAIVPKEFHKEFEIKFKEISVPVINGYNGLLSLEIAKPSKWNPNEFVMISRWEKEEHLVKFAGERWNEPHIPNGMEKYIKHCTVYHYININISETP
jgi:heme-degrading monooxygenase HmoA